MSGNYTINLHHVLQMIHHKMTFGTSLTSKWLYVTFELEDFTTADYYILWQGRNILAFFGFFFFSLHYIELHSVSPALMRYGGLDN